MQRLAFQSQKFAGPADARPPFAAGRLRLSRARRFRRFLWRLAMAALAGSSLAFAVAFREARNPVSAGSGLLATPSAPLPAWVEIVRAEELFELAAPEFAGEPKFYEARRHRAGGGRQDILVLGGLNASAPFLRLVFYQAGDEAAPDAAFFVELARRAAEAGRAITYAAQPTALHTHIGVFEVADLTLTRSEASDAACLGFRFADAAMKLRITGFACGGEIGPVPASGSKSWLACLLDRIDLAAAAQDQHLIAFFAARELNSDTACAKN